jgi:hypothetical protein
MTAGRNQGNPIANSNTNSTIEKKARGRRPDSAADWRPCDDRLEKVLEAREGGATLRQAAKAAGVHVATVCRWQNRIDWFGEAMLDAADYARRRRFSTLPLRRPRVPCHPECPLCGRPVVVRTGEMLRFWRCSQWPRCRFASWRPRAPEDCSECGGARFWSYSRRSIACGSCGNRARIIPH